MCAASATGVCAPDVRLLLRWKWWVLTASPLAERLYHLWWLSHREDQSEEFRERVPGSDEGELDLANPDGAAGQVIALAQRLAEQRRALPWGKAEADLAASIDAHYSHYGSRADRRLIRVPAQDYEYSADPVLALQGAHLHAPLTRDTPLPCRTPDRLVTRASGITTSDVADLVTQVNLSHLPPCFHALLTEFLILDRALATTGRIRDVTGTLPEYGTDAWEMPWQPLYLMWKAEYFPLPFRDGTTAHWEFIERSRYQWQGTGTPSTPLTISGRQILTPAAGHALDGSLTAYARVRDQLPADSIQHLHAKVRSTDLLSQTLDGFGAAIAQRRPDSGLQPAGPLADLVGNGNYPPPDPGGLPSSDWDPWPESTFQELRAGQLAFHALSVVDRFGRAVNLIGEASHFRPEMPRTMRPAHPVSGHDSERPRRRVTSGSLTTRCTGASTGSLSALRGSRTTSTSSHTGRRPSRVLRESGETRRSRWRRAPPSPYGSPTSTMREARRTGWR
ncbi:hypothetical protein SAMN05428954_1328 [Streptomyces sp. 2112.3]|nr:hypothetical protein SAMN05428954_1328 [Streptomyces sp. 2112.3]